MPTATGVTEVPATTPPWLVHVAGPVAAIGAAGGAPEAVPDGAAGAAFVGATNVLRPLRQSVLTLPATGVTAATPPAGGVVSVGIHSGMSHQYLVMAPSLELKLLLWRHF